MVAITGKAIPLVNENEIDAAGLEVFQQLKEGGALVGSGRLCAIHVALHDGDAVGSCVLVQFRLLRFDGGLMLALGGVAGVIDSGFQMESPPQKRQR